MYITELKYIIRDYMFTENNILKYKIWYKFKLNII